MLVRVSIIAADRRVDLAVPGAVPVAELVPTLAARVGLLDDAPPGGGYRLVTHDGRVLSPGSGLAAQGVADGALLAAVAEADELLPVRYDDPVEAVSDAVDKGVPAWDSSTARRAALSASVVLVLVGVGSLVARARPAPPVPSWTHATLASTTVLALVVVVVGVLPTVAFGITGALRETGVIDPTRVAAEVAAAHRVLLGLLVSVGVLPALAAPAAVSRGAAGAVLSALAPVAVMLQTRHLRARAEVLAGVVCGTLGLVSAAVSAMVMHPPWRVAVSALLVAAGVGVLAVIVLSPPGSVRRARLADALESLAVLAVVPTLAVATGSVSALLGKV